MNLCPDCSAKPGEQHQPNCDVERCPSCGGQALQCLHNHGDKTYCHNTSEEVKDEECLPWTGEWPGNTEAREYGFYCKWVEGRGWQDCEKDDPNARPDLNRLHEECEWDKTLKRMVLQKE
jgi:hypothetical protein